MAKPMFKSWEDAYKLGYDWYSDENSAVAEEDGIGMLDLFDNTFGGHMLYNILLDGYMDRASREYGHYLTCNGCEEGHDPGVHVQRQAEWDAYAAAFVK